MGRMNNELENETMIDFHTHTLLSDGALVPAEHIRRAQVRGYRILGMSDHVDLATMEQIIPVLLVAAARENELGEMAIFAGVELTHVRPAHIAEATAQARRCGSQYVICHGETIAEPVQPGTNRAAIEAGVDILAHPGLISPEDATLAAERGVLLEITAKTGHSLCNGYVVNIARQTGAKLIFGSDAHDPEQMPTRDYAEAVCRGAGLDQAEIAAMFAEAEKLAQKLNASRK